MVLTLRAHSLPFFEILDNSGQHVCFVKGPCCQWLPCQDVDFHLSQADNPPFGTITKKWSGLAKEVFTDADNFGVDCAFPVGTC